MTTTQATAGWIRVARSMALGALYDVVFAVAILFFAETASRILRLDVPADPVYFRFLGIFLLLVAGTYVLPARWPQRYEGVVWVAIGGRFLGFLYLGGVWLGGREAAFLVLAAGDLFFSVLHLGLLLAARRN